MDDAIEELEEFDCYCDPEHPYFDPQWFERGDLPEDHQWFSIIGEYFLLKGRFKQLRRIEPDVEIDGKHSELITEYFKDIEGLLPVLEDQIRHRADSIDFTNVLNDITHKVNTISAHFSRKKRNDKLKAWGRKNNADIQRLWLALWAVYYRKHKNKKKIVDIVDKLGKLLLAIITGERKDSEPSAKEFAGRCL